MHLDWDHIGYMNGHVANFERLTAHRPHADDR